jgi:hypothetical protein
VVEPIDADRWNRVPMPSVWSIDKDAVHVSDAAVYHHWIVRLTIRRDVPSSRPAIERTQLTTDLSPDEAIDLIRAPHRGLGAAAPRLDRRTIGVANATAASPDADPRLDDRARADRPLRHPPSGDRGQVARLMAHRCAPGINRCVLQR